MLGLAACNNNSTPLDVDESIKMVDSSTINIPEAEPITNQKTEDGMHLLLRKGMTIEEVNPIQNAEKLIEYSADFKAEDDFSYAVVSPVEKVAFSLAQEPDKVTEDNDPLKTRLLLSLDENGTQQLETFTGKHVGKSVAMVIGGEVVSVHKIREAIVGGKLQVTNCSGTACERLFMELQDNVQK